MDFIAVNELKRPRVVRERLAASEEMILTSNGRPMAVLMYVGDDDDPEDVLKAAREARRVREHARRSGAAAMSDAEINGVIAATRRDRMPRS
jgi:hypothetical protein